MRRLMLVLHNIRSAYNVGAILRSAECFGVERVVYSGYTPHLGKGLPHERERVRAAIHKTALGAEEMVAGEFAADVLVMFERLRGEGYAIWALEQADLAVRLERLPKDVPEKMVLVLGEEVGGVPRELLAAVDGTIEIGQRGRKESLNVSVAAGVAMWELMRGATS